MGESARRRDRAALLRQLENELVNLSDIMEHMEVIGSDGQHIGTVDHLAVKLTKSDPDADGRHHIIPVDLIDSIEDDKLVLLISAADAADEEEEIDD